MLSLAPHSNRSSRRSHASLLRNLAVSILLAGIVLAGCDTTGPQRENNEPSTDELRSQVQEAFGAQVTDLRVQEIEVGSLHEGLQGGEVAMPVVAPDNDVTEVTLEARPANLRPDSVDTGIMRQGDATERVPLPPAQSYVVGTCAGEGSSCGGYTVLDDGETMLRGFVAHPDHGLSYVQSVNHILQTQEYPNQHVFYNAANTDSTGVTDGEYAAPEESFLSPKRNRAKLQTNESTSVVLDGDADFYNTNPNTVWRRQRSLFLATKITMGAYEPQTSDVWRLDLSIAGQEVWASGGPSTSDPDQLMDRLTDPNYLLINPLSNKQMHLFLVGYNVNGLAGRAAGIGTPNGWGGAPGENHLFSEARPIQPMKFKKLLLAHETGHLIGGTHGNAVKFGCSPFPVCGRSLMNHNIWLNQMYFFSNANDTRVSSVINAVLP